MTVPGRFDGKVVVITGGETGIGRAVAERCGREGASVAIAGINQSELEQTVSALRGDGVEALGIVTDVRDEASIEHALSEAVGAFGKVDGVHANAGGGIPKAPITEMSLEDWQRVVTLNLTGVWLTLRAGARQMAAQGTGGSLLATGSSTAIRPGDASLPYVASKAAVHVLVKSLAVELAPQGIRVNAIAPGLTETPLTTGRPGHIERGLRIVPLGRPMQAHEIAGLAAFMLSDEAAGMTGSVHSYDGGRTAD